MRADALLAMALNHALLDLQRRVRKTTPSIDWDTIYAEASRRSGTNNKLNYSPRSPRVDS
jgi:hypothetical protein